MPGLATPTSTTPAGHLSTVNGGVAAATSPRLRQVLSAVNGAQDPAAGSDAGSSAGEMRFARDDVMQLLKDSIDEDYVFVGMACICWLEWQEKRHVDIENQLTTKIEGLSFMMEENRPRNCELQQVRDYRDNQSALVQSLTVEIANYKELTRKLSEDLDMITTKTTALEEIFPTQRDEIQTLQHQLAVANEKLKRVDLSATVTMAEYQEQKKAINDLQHRVTDAELQIVEAENLHKKLHNTLLALKGNIRVFCRVQPVLLDSDCNGIEGPVVSYPTSTVEALT